MILRDARTSFLHDCPTVNAGDLGKTNPDDTSRRLKMDLQRWKHRCEPVLVCFKVKRARQTTWKTIGQNEVMNLHGLANNDSIDSKSVLRDDE